MKWFQGFGNKNNPWGHQAGVKGRINLPAGHALLQQIEFIGLTEQDLGLLRAAKESVHNFIDYASEQFYLNIGRHPAMLALVSENSNMERLKGALKEHLYSMFDGIIDESYLQKRYLIAGIHVKIGLPKLWYMGSFQTIMDTFTAMVLESVQPSSEAAAKTIAAFSRMLNLEQQIVLEVYDRKIMEGVASACYQLGEFSNRTDESVNEVKLMYSRLHEVTIQGLNSSQASEQYSEEGKQQLQELSSYYTSLYNTTNEMVLKLELLRQLSDQIVTITSIVQDIADKTQLLSLNAAIEAARAAEHGRGFNVVAGEVRKLADQTKDSVKNVSTIIANMTRQIESISAAFQEMFQIMTDGDQTIGETKEKFEQITRAMSITTQQGRLWNEEMERMLASFQTIEDNTREVSCASERLKMLVTPASAG